MTTTKKNEKLTDEQIKLGSEYLAMTNICALDERVKKSIKDLPSLRNALRAASDRAIEGAMEGMAMDGGGELDRYETEAINGVQAEVDSFAKDLKRGGRHAAFWVKQLKEELPFLINEKR